ncbi:MAG: site-2 protease family protein [Thermoguttaceae bacterium]
MSGSWRIGTLSGIGIYLHWTFLILLAWVGLTHFTQGDDLADAMHGLVFMVALFSIIVLHELGHALAARRYGIATRDITLLPIGGVAQMERMPEDPKQELVVAIAGPAVNVALALLCIAGILFLVGPANFATVLANGASELGFLYEQNEKMPLLSDIPLLGADFLAKMLIVNVSLVVFNLLPAFPMDGGRVLRSLLALKIDYVRATQAAASVGQAMALLFGFLGLFHNPFLVFIALFVWMGAASESSMVQLKAGLRGVPLTSAMVTQFRTLAPSDQIGAAAGHVIAGFQHDFPVVEDGRLVGVLTRSDLLKSLAEEGMQQPVASVMRRNFETVDPAEMLDMVFDKLQGCDCQAIPVVRGGELYGIVTMESVGEFLTIQKAVRRGRR